MIDCPTADYLDSLLEKPDFIKHQMTATDEKDVASLVVHFSPKNVMEHPKYDYLRIAFIIVKKIICRYKKWMDRFSASTHHLVLNESNSCMGSVAVHRIQHKLNLLNQDIFPLLGDCGIQIENVVFFCFNKILELSYKNFVVGYRITSSKKIKNRKKGKWKQFRFINIRRECWFY